MVKYALRCDLCDVRFEGWFSSSSAFDDQKSAGELSCPHCGSNDVVKQIMAPSVRDSKSSSPAGAMATPQFTPEQFKAVAKAVREHVSSTHEYVGDKFAETARSMHYGETEQKSVWGETTVQEAKDLVEEGVPALPLPAPMAPEKPADPKKLN